MCVECGCEVQAPEGEPGGRPEGDDEKRDAA